MVKKIQFFLIFLLISLLGFGQPDFNFNGITMSNGLPHNAVRSIIQDNQGFMWFGTDNGVCRFDGLHLKNYNITNDSTSIYVTGFALVDNKLYVGTGSGLYLLDLLTGGSQKLFGNEISCVISDITINSSDTSVWVATDGNGAFMLHNNQLKQYDFPEFRNDISSILAVNNGDILLCTNGRNQSFFLKKSGSADFKKLVVENLPKNVSVRNLYQDKQGKILLGAWDAGVWEVDKNYKAQLLFYQPNTVSHIHYLTEYSDNEYLICSDNGLLWFDSKSGKSHLWVRDNSNSTSLSNNFVYSVCKDREGGLWVGTFYGGVNYSKPQISRFKNFTSLPTANSLNGNVVSCFCEDSQHNIWIGTEDGGLNCMSAVDNKFSNYLSHVNIHALCCDGDILWIGTYSSGIIKFDIKSKKVKTHYEYPNFPDVSCYSIFKDSKGRIWCSSWTNLYQYESETDSFKNIKPLGGIVYDIKEDNDGTLWIATQSSGLYCFCPDKYYFKQYVTSCDSSSISHNDVNSVYISPQNEIFVGTASGVCKYNRKDDNFTRLNLKLNKNEISCLFMKDSVLWISTPEGLAAYSDNRFQVFTTSDGLCSNLFQPKSGLLTQNNNIYFGSVNGFCTFEPNSFIINDIAPKVAITDVEVLGASLVSDTAVNYKNFISFGKDTNSISISYVALSYCMPDKNQYYVKLEGIDKDWVFLGTKSKYTIKDIEPGKYVFCVKASNNDGILGDETRLTLVIRSNPFLSRNAFVIYFLLFILVLLTLKYLLSRKNDDEVDIKKAVVKKPENINNPIVASNISVVESHENDNEFLEKITKLIDENITNTEMTSTFLAEQLGLSRSSLYAKIKQITDNTPSELIQQIRLQKAQQLLLKSKLRVNEVAYMVGFSNPSYFSKCFQKQFGVKPSEINQK